MVAGELDEDAYVHALLRDLDADFPAVGDRDLVSIFIGGGTPSLFSGAAIGRLLDGVRDRLILASDIEITIEANPGAVDRQHFLDYRLAGVNRISIGAQSFARDQLHALGRIHGPEEIKVAVDAARAAGFANMNLDIMYGLPGQTADAARADITKAISLEPEHISYYQLTIEPNTRFYTAPPKIPDDDQLWEVESTGHALLEAAGYVQYEVSAFAQNGQECRHNRNYWEFGDYLGIGAGAHGKISDLECGRILRTRKPKAPDTYIRSTEEPSLRAERVKQQDLALEFMLNTLRLKNGFDPLLFERRTGRSLNEVQTQLDTAKNLGLLDVSDDLIRPTPNGWRFLNELQALFIS